MDTEKEPLMDDNLRRLPKERKTSSKTIIMTLSVVVVLLVTSVVILLLNQKKDPAVENTDKYVINTDKELNNVKVSVFDDGIFNINESFTLVNYSGTWKLDGQEDIILDQTQAKLIPSCTRLRESRLIAEAPTEAKLEQYGLKNPQRTFNFNFVDGTQIILQLGRRITADGGFYAKLGNSPKVYLISDVQGENLITKKAQLRYMPSFIPTALVNGVSKLSIKRGNENFVLDKMEEKGINFNRWTVSEPINVLLDDELVTKYLSSLSVLAPSEYVEKANFFKYGLVAPYLKAEIVSYDDEKYTIEIGSLTPDKKYRYCRVNNSEVYMIGVDKILSLEQFNLYSLVKKNITYYFLTDTKSIQVSNSQKQIVDMVYTRKPKMFNGKQVIEDKQPVYIETFTLNGKPAEEGQFKDYFGFIIDLSYDGVLPKEYKEGKVVYSYIINLNGKTDKVEFLEYDNYKKAVRLNGEIYFYINNEQLEKFIEATDMFINGTLYG